MHRFGSALLAAGVSVFILTLPASAQAQYEVQPSLPVPTPPEEQAEAKTPEFYSMAIDGVKPIPFNARNKAAEISTHQRLVETTSKLRSLPPESRGYLIKAGAFRSFENAQRLHAKLFSIGSAQITHRQAKGLDFYGVYLGPWKTREEAQIAYDLALKAGMQDGEIIAPN